MFLMGEVLKTFAQEQFSNCDSLPINPAAIPPTTLPSAIAIGQTMARVILGQRRSIMKSLLAIVAEKSPGSYGGEMGMRELILPIKQVPVFTRGGLGL